MFELWVWARQQHNFQNKKSCDRMQTFEHDKTHPFDYTMNTTTIALMFACIFFSSSVVCIFFLVAFLTAMCFFFCFFFFGSSFAYLIRLDGKRDCWCRSWNAERAQFAHTTFGWRVEIFPWKCAVSPTSEIEREWEWICISAQPLMMRMITWNGTYAYASTLK